MNPKIIRRSKQLRLAAEITNNFRSVAFALGKDPKEILKELVESWTSAQAAKAVQNIKKCVQAKAG